VVQDCKKPIDKNRVNANKKKSSLMQFIRNEDQLTGTAAEAVVAAVKAVEAKAKATIIISNGRDPGAARIINELLKGNRTLSTGTRSVGLSTKRQQQELYRLQRQPIRLESTSQKERSCLPMQRKNNKR
jgi:hypothetical protein